MYQSECAPKWIRGAIVSGYQWFIRIGLLIGAVVNSGTKDIDWYSCYRIAVSIELIWCSILVIVMFILPESARYFILKGRIGEAYKCEARLPSFEVNDPQVENVIKELISNTELMKVYGSGNYSDCFKMGPQ
jgi:hypothetical protein